MPDDPALVEGPEFAERVRKAEALTAKLQNNQWNFSEVPELFARRAACDVVAKEITLIHDGHTQTRIGRLVMTGVGRLFNLMGPESPLSTFKSTHSGLLDDINRQIGSGGLYDFDDFRKLGRPQEVEFFNFTTFYQLRDLAFWSALMDCGLFPSGFEQFARHIASGRVIHNVLFSPSLPSEDVKRPVVMEARCLSLQFPTPVIQWMYKPLFGGIVRETMHIENVLTLEPTDVSHPYLPLVAEGRVEYGHQRYHLRRFAGRSPKDGLRGPDVPPEGTERPRRRRKG